ncbi:MAG: acyltransferase [Bacteroidota bacterium]
MLYRLLKSLYRFIKRLYRPVKIRFLSWRAAQVCGGYRSYPTVNAPCNFTSNTFFGKNNHFNGMKISGQGRVNIGDNFHSGYDCKIITSYHNFDSGTKIPYDNTYIHKNVTIEDNVWIGDNVIILGGVTIGEGAVIQAGSVVAKSVPKYAIAGGHPALPFKHRNIEHYETLKKQNHFH